MCLPFHHHQDEHVDLNSVLFACTMLAGLSTPQSLLDVDSTVRDTWIFCRKWTQCSEIGTSGFICLLKIPRTAMHSSKFPAGMLPMKGWLLKVFWNVQNPQTWVTVEWSLYLLNFPICWLCTWWTISKKVHELTFINKKISFTIIPVKKKSYLLRSTNNLHGIKNKICTTHAHFIACDLFFTWYVYVTIPLLEII